MSTFNINSVNNATISLGNGENVNIKKLSIEIDGNRICTERQVSAVIKNGILIIETK